MTTSKSFWYYKPTSVYNYDMTMVAGFISDEGIVCVGDGRVNSFEEEIINDEQVKLFQLSPTTVIMPAGGAADNIEFIMNTLQDLFATFTVYNVNDITIKFLKYCERYVERSKPDKLPIFTIAGYNSLPTGILEPKLYVVQFDGTNWTPFEPAKDYPYVISGYNKQSIVDLIATEYEERKSSINDMNLLALKALEKAKQDNPNYIGGKTALWNILPSLKIHKFTQDEISKLETQL